MRNHDVESVEDISYPKTTYFKPQAGQSSGES